VLRHIRLLILDLDYLIFDCAALKVKALRESLISFADAIPHDVRLPDAMDAEEEFRDHGRHWTQELQLGLDDASMIQLQSDYRIHEERLVSAGAGRIYPGLTGLLAQCRQNGVSAAIGAEASRDYLMVVSDRHDLDNLFEMVYCAEEFGKGSADEMIDEIMSRAEVNRSETLVLGTRPGFFESAHNLDILTIGCGWGLQCHDALGAADLQTPTISQVYPAIVKADGLAAQYLS
jgi:phosphoglycolate phosphatase-like HAD superfamily hydrolase